MTETERPSRREALRMSREMRDLQARARTARAAGSDDVANELDTMAAELRSELSQHGYGTLIF